MKMKSWLLMMVMMVMLSSAIQGGVEGLFFNGVNQAWVQYGNDFGNSPPASVLQSYEQTFEAIQKSNSQGQGRQTVSSVRIWVHCGAESTPQFNHSGYVSATDSSNSFFSDIGQLLDAAQARGVEVYFCLWNLAVVPSDALLGLIWDAGKLDSYFQVVLIPWLKQFGGHPALAGFDIVNEPEGAMAYAWAAAPCQDTTFLTAGSFDWTGLSLPLGQLQLFVAKHAAVIAQYSRVQATVGCWNAQALTDALPGARNLWSDACLAPFGGNLTIFHVHTYAQTGSYDAYSPFLHSYAQYQLNKPLIVAEFSADQGAGLSSPQQYQYLYCHGYAGAWGWQANGSGEGADSLSTLMSGMSSIPSPC